MQHIINHLRPRLAPRRTTFYLMALISLLAVVALMGSLTNCDCEDGKSKKSDSTAQVSGQPPKRYALDVQNPAGNTFQVMVTSPGPPHGSEVHVFWYIPDGATNVQTNPPAGNAGKGCVAWVLPVNPDTGKTMPVSVNYTAPPGSQVTDTFMVWGPFYTSTARSFARTVSGQGAQAMASAGLLPARSPAARQAGYYRWQTTTLVAAPGLALTADLCQDGVDLLRSDTAFIALRFPVQPPPLADTDPYTLPVCLGDGYSPYLGLLDERSVPATTILTAALEYKPRYLTFAENELPAAPGEHWLALGAVTSSTVGCAGLPELPAGQWEVQADLWLDFGGLQDTNLGAVLPIYYCYEGQASPIPLGVLGARASATSYQGWGITCLGPDSLTLRDGPGDWELAGEGIGWVTATQTISFAHTLYNWTLYPHPPLTFTLEATSTLPAGWAFYADPAGQTPLVGPVRVDDYLEFWVFGQAPADAADGPYELFVTARTGDALPADQQATDLMWVGDWVAPPPSPFLHRVYLPLVQKSAP